MSTLKVDTIQTTGGVTLLSDPEANYVLDQWRLNANFTSHGNTLTGWERPDHATHGRIGTGMTESSGIFTFPSTGLYMVTVQAMMLVAANDGAVGVDLKISTDSGSSTSAIASAYEGDTSSSDSNETAYASALINVTNTSTFQVSLLAISIASGSAIIGDSDNNYTTITFERKGPSQ